VEEATNPQLLRIVSINAEGGKPALLVLIRLKTAQVSYHGLLMPGPDLMTDPDTIAKLLDFAEQFRDKPFPL